MTTISFAEINGAGCRFAIDGDGPRTLALIHELGGSLNSWDALLPLLPAGLRVLRHDLRGAGMSEKVRGVNSLDVLADDVIALLDHAGAAGPAIVLGAAMGAAVAVRVATRHAARVDRLVLVGPALGVPEERQQAARELTDKVEREGLRAIADGLLPRAFPEELWTEADARALALARWLGADPEGYAANYRILIEQNLRPELAQVRCPTLVIAGRHDPFGPPDAIDAGTALIADRRFVVAEGGHFLAVQSPRLLAEALAGFLAEP